MEEKAVEEGGIRKILKKEQGENFYGERGVKKFYERTERKGENFGGNLLSQICTLRKGGCYPFSWYVGSGARKPVGFLGPANLLVGRVENQSRQ